MGVWLLIRKWAAGAAVAVLAALAIQAIIAYGEAVGWFAVTTSWIGAVISFIANLSDHAWFPWFAAGLLGLTSGFALGAWLDALARRRALATVSAPVTQPPASPQPSLAATDRPNPVGRTTAPRLASPPVTLTTVKRTPAPMVGRVVTVEEMHSLDRPFIQAWPDEQPARPHLLIAGTGPELRGAEHRRTEVIGWLSVSNETNSDMSACSVIIESLIVKGEMLQVERPVRTGRERKPSFSLAQAAPKRLNFVHRRVNVVPEEPFYFVLTEDLQIQENNIYEVNVRLENGSDIVTRAVFQLELGTYEDMRLSLLGQSSWRGPAATKIDPSAGSSMWPIRELFFHIKPDVLIGNPPGDWQRVGGEIHDQLALGALQAFGRAVDEFHKVLGGHLPLVPIPREYWEKATFAYNFFRPEDDDAGHTFTTVIGPPVYSDLRVSKPQALAIWPNARLPAR